VTKKTIFDNVAREVQVKAQWIASRRTPEEAKREYDIGTGYLCALYDASVFDRETYQVAADLLKAAYHAALQVAEKKAALGADNTENGKPNPFNLSIAIIVSNVKKEGEFA
jgi:hypothetical protein